MTNEEAIREILWVKDYGYKPDRMTIGTDRILEAFRMAIGTLEKEKRQMTKRMCKQFYCPACGKDVYAVWEIDASSSGKMTLAIEALGKAERYRWHDLRKNPDDLPEKQGEYDIVYKFGDGTGRTYEVYNKTYGFCTPEEYPCIAWREIEPGPFEGE